MQSAVFAALGLAAWDEWLLDRGEVALGAEVLTTGAGLDFDGVELGLAGPTVLDAVRVVLDVRTAGLLVLDVVALAAAVVRDVELAIADGAASWLDDEHPVSRTRGRATTAKRLCMPWA